MHVCVFFLKGVYMIYYSCIIDNSSFDPTWIVFLNQSLKKISLS